jgi:hypothetical protein
MRGAEDVEPEMSFRHGYQQGAIEVFCAVERFLDPATREVLQAWIEKDVFMWRVKAMLAHPPNWRLSMLDGLLRLQLLQPQLSGYEHPAPSPTRAAPELEHGV